MPSVISTAVVFALVAALFMLSAFFAQHTNSDERITAFILAAFFIIASILTFLRRPWVRVVSSVLLALSAFYLAFVGLSQIPPSPAYSSSVVRAALIGASFGLLVLFAFLAFGRGAKQYFTRQRPSE